MSSCLRLRKRFYKNYDKNNIFLAKHPFQFLSSNTLAYVCVKLGKVSCAAAANDCYKNFHTNKRGKGEI